MSSSEMSPVVTGDGDVVDRPLSSYEAEDFDAARVPDDQIASIIRQGERLRKFVSEVTSMAERRLRAGETLPGLKLVAVPSKRKLTMVEQLRDRLVADGLLGALRPETITNLEAALKKAVKDGSIEDTEADAIRDGFILKPPGDVKVDLASSSKPAVTAAQAQANDAERAALAMEARRAVIETSAAEAADAVAPAEAPAKAKAPSKRRARAQRPARVRAKARAATAGATATETAAGAMTTETAAEAATTRTATQAGAEATETTTQATAAEAKVQTTAAETKVKATAAEATVRTEAAEAKASGPGDGASSLEDMLS